MYFLKRTIKHVDILLTTAPQTDKLGEYKKMDVGQKLASRCLDRVNEHPNLVTHSILFIFLGCSPGHSLEFWKSGAQPLIPLMFRWVTDVCPT